MKRAVGVLGFITLAVGLGCSGPGGVSGGSVSSQVGPTQTAAGSERYVTVGFWTDPLCRGEPVSTNRFPVHYGDSQCYAWPGRSGENSASRFSCGRDSFSYTQWTTLTCTGGQNPNGTRKTSTLVDCVQDVPPTLFARIVEFSGCAGAP